MTLPQTKILNEIASMIEVDREDISFNRFGELEFNYTFNLRCADLILIANILKCQTRHLWISPRENGFVIKVEK